MVTSGAPVGSRTKSSSIVESVFLSGETTSIVGAVVAGAGRLQRAVESVEACNRGTPLGEVAVDRDKERQRCLHGGECASGLHQTAELDASREIRRATTTYGNMIANRV